ncbi:MAG: hypothetical protein ACRD4S_11085 [Candidatus Acidiferrales bacterium]
MSSILALSGHAMMPHFSFPAGPVVNEQIMLRWIHFVAGIIWIGLLYFFNLVAFPAMKQLDAAVRGKVFPALMSRAMWWFRWSALVTVLVGLRYFFTILSADARNAGNPSLALQWLGWWFLVWLVAYALIYPLQLPAKGALDNPWLRAIAIAIILIVASWVILALNSGPEVSNSQLAIAVGGGLGLLMLLNAWGVVWRVQKRLIAWTRASVENGAPMPAEAERLARWAFLSSRVAFWMSFPMLFFMAAAEHYPFLSGMSH